MRTHVILAYLGRIFLFNAVFLFFSFLISLFRTETSTLPLLYGFLIASLFGVFPLIFQSRETDVRAQEGIYIVVFGWLATCLIGMLPYLLWGGEFSLANAWFESVSGFTTTGSSILNDIEILPYGLLFWRSATHWIGGVGIIVFVLLILPSSSQSKVILFNMEVSSIARESFRARTADTARILLVVYAGLTILQTLLLWMFGMSFFDAINHSFATIATGGFSTKNSSLLWFDSVAIEVTAMIFMILGGTNFALLFGLFATRKFELFKNIVFRWYAITIFGAITLVVLKLWADGYGDFLTSLRIGSFQVVSLATTTGFANTDSSAWPAFTQVILLLLMLQGACSGSTSGAIKADRLLLFFRSLARQIRLMQYPRAVINIRFNHRVLPEELVASAVTFIVVYLLITTLVALALTGLDVDPLTSFSASIATIGGVGPGFGAVSNLSNFSTLPEAGKYLLTFNMLLGRLEIFGLLSLFFIRQWK
jgi:trk system potassium uptake protein